MPPTRAKVGDLFPGMRWVKEATQETNPSSSIQIQTNGQAQTRKGVIENQIKGGTYVPKPGKDVSICPKTLHKVIFYRKYFLKSDLDESKD